MPPKLQHDAKRTGYRRHSGSLNGFCARPDGSWSARSSMTGFAPVELNAEYPPDAQTAWACSSGTRSVPVSSLLNRRMVMSASSGPVKLCCRAWVSLMVMWMGLGPLVLLTVTWGGPRAVTDRLSSPPSTCVEVQMASIWTNDGGLSGW